nr:TonB-dependent receptor plug domain-containing protein [uncultured Draconibacterium sp.]
MFKNLTLIAFVLLFVHSAKAQSIENYFADQTNQLQQKLYLNTDRELYFSTDTLWFSAKLLDAKTHQPESEDCNLYLEIIDEKGKLVDKKLFAIINGKSFGSVTFTENLFNEGRYLIRAYTDYLKPLGEELYFAKGIYISTIKNASSPKQKRLKSKKLFVDFYPEGGFLLKDQMNQMSFMAYDENGRPIEIRGSLLNEKGEKVVDFNTGYKGRGRFYFVPKTENYKIEIQGYYDVEYDIPSVQNDGAKLMLHAINSNGARLTVLSNYPGDSYYIAIFHRGDGKHFIKLNRAQIERTITIEPQYLYSGVNRLLLLDNNYIPQSERLVFVDKGEEVDLHLELNQEQFQTRSEVELDITSAFANESDEFASVSVAVVSENALAARGVQQNIRSYLLLDSELKGYMPSSADYFVDDDEISAKEKMDLLMLTNGWRNYLWNSPVDTLRTEDTQFGVRVQGNVKRLGFNIPFRNTEVFLNVLNDAAPVWFSTQTDSLGNFDFKNVQFADTATVMVQGLNYKSKTRTRIDLTSVGFEPSSITKNYLRPLEYISGTSVSAMRLRYLNELRLQEFRQDTSSIALDEIKIVGKRKQITVEPTGVYCTPDHSLKVTTEDRAYSTITNFLVGRFPGVHVVNGKISIRQGLKQPLYLIDGIPVDSTTFRMLTMYQIDKIEVIKGPSAAIYGSRGANGVLSVLTRKGADDIPVSDYIPGTIIQNIMGFSKYREFYSPVYTADNIDSEKPDYRTTLYWNPNIVIENETQKLRFFTCDNLSNYKIIVEGITNTGKTCIGQTDFVVNERKKESL